MKIFGDIKWYNILIIVLLVVVTAAIILLPSSGNQGSTGVCATLCPPPKEQFCSAPIEQPVHHTPIQLTNPPKPTTDNEPKHELVLYYAMWCGHSRAFLGEWEKFNTWAQNNLDKVRVSSVRCEDGNEATCSQKGIQGYPTVVMYLPNGSEHKYEGERTADGLKKFASNFV